MGAGGAGHASSMLAPLFVAVHPLSELAVPQKVVGREITAAGFDQLFERLDMEHGPCFSRVMDKPTDFSYQHRMTCGVELAPMQGFTDHFFRKAYLSCFTGIDVTYSPFIVLDKGRLRNRDLRELEAGRDEPDFTPQIAARSPEEASKLAQQLRLRGLADRRINLNLGCPYPMLTKKGRGAGALPHPERIEAILTALFAGPFREISIKTRLGMSHPEEFEALIPVFNRFPLSKVIIHPRVASQKYGGSPDWRAFGEYARQLSAPTVANGDIETRQDVDALISRYPFISAVMLGRGVLMDPFLPQDIRGRARPCDSDARLREFHNQLFGALQVRLSTRHLLDKLASFWSYFCLAFPDGKKAYKRIKKCRSRERYLDIVTDIFDNNT